MNTQPKLAEAKLLPLAEYYRFCEWWKNNWGHRSDDIRNIALEACIFARKNVIYTKGEETP